jgi:hypothetical protein
MGGCGSRPGRTHGNEVSSKRPPALTASWSSSPLSVSMSGSLRPFRSCVSKAIAASCKRTNRACPSSVSSTTWIRRLSASRRRVISPRASIEFR